ncbi:uncharacterized protein LOC100906956 [Galendromus occidentalis]|uniref:Uncharacterized protein LOC100906956 n=1 Tax=Galendromus occidentalis TaxID=34638 RepID=A0AAJ6QXG8_9ACAR|nr:uncharacterized protein LOC100906956 [Galendromus occidentalis]
MPTPKILKVVCRGTAELDAKNHFYKVIAPYIDSLSRLGAIARCNPTTLTTRNLTRLRESFEEDLAADLSDTDLRLSRLQLEVLQVLYRALELFELQGSTVAVKFLSDVVEGDQTKPELRFELMQNERYASLRYELSRMEATKNALNDSTTQSKILKLADIVEKHVRQTVTVSRILIAVPTVAMCEEVNKMLASLSALLTSYVYDTSRFSKTVLKNFVESRDNCLVVITSPESLNGQNISLNGISLAICLDVRKDVFRKPPYWQGSIIMLVTDVENKSFDGREVLAASPRKPPATLKRGLANQASRGRKAFLTKEEQAYFDRHFKSSTKITLPSNGFDPPPKSQATYSVQLSVSKWRPWQSRLQDTYQVGHSTDSQVLVDVFKFCDEISSTPDGSRLDNHERELATHFRAEDVHEMPVEASESKPILIDEGELDTLDTEDMAFLAITPEMDRYVLDSAEKITDYLAQLGFVEVRRTPKPKPDRAFRTPEMGNRTLARRTDSSPLSVTGCLPTASTPLGYRAPRADFKLTPITKKDPMTPSSHLRDSVREADPDPNAESRLSLTALVKVVQKRKKQKNLQYFFSNKLNQPTELSDIVETSDKSSKSEIQDGASHLPGPLPYRELSPPSTTEEKPMAIADDFPAVDGDALGAIRNPQTESSTPPVDGRKELEPDFLSREQGLLEARRTTLSLDASDRNRTNNLIGNDVTEDDDDLFDDIDVTMKLQEAHDDGIDADGGNLTNSIRNAREHILVDADKPTGKPPIREPSIDVRAVKPEPKPKIRSVFDALDDPADNKDCHSAHTAVLNIINNIPTRSKEIVESPEITEPETVGNILPIEFQKGSERTSEAEENSDDLFDCVEELLLPKKETESQDDVLQKLLKKADEQSSKKAGDKRPPRSDEVVSSSQRPTSPKNKGFRKQKLRAIAENGRIKAKGESSPESLKTSFSEPQLRRNEEGVETVIGRSRSQKEVTRDNARAAPMDGRNPSCKSKGSSAETRKRSRVASASSDEESLHIQRRRKNPFASLGGSFSQGFIAQLEAKKPTVKKAATKGYFDDEAEVDSIDSVSEDEDDQPDAYEMNSFVDDGEGIAHSQGMYRRLDKDLSPIKNFRRPVKHVPYEDCFSQMPPSDDDSYGDDSFVEHGSVAEVTLPAEITVMQAPPETQHKKRKGRRKAFICDDSSDSDRVSGGEAKPGASSPRKSSQRSFGARADVASSSTSGLKLNDRKIPPKNVILVNTYLLEILPEILVGLQRTFDKSHIEPVDMSALENHPVDLYLGDLCIKVMSLDQLRSGAAETRKKINRFRLLCEKPVLLVVAPSQNHSDPEQLFKAIIGISEIDIRTFYVKNQVELLMLLKCIVRDLQGNEYLIEYLESEELQRLLRLPQLNILTATALLRVKQGKARSVIQTSSAAEIGSICNVSERFAETICAAFRTC